MKKVTLLIGTLLIAMGLSAQTQYVLTKVDLGGIKDTWGAVVTNSGEIFFSGSGQGKDSEGNTVSRLYMLSPSGKVETLFDRASREYPHMGAPYVTPDGQELYFSVSGKEKVVIKKGIFKAPELYYPQQIAMSKRNRNGSWGDIVLFEHNVVDYSSGDPWVSNDGQFLYFTSNRPGGLGGLDIWRSKRNSDGSWGRPENLKEINTSSDERSPRFDKHGNFYYASNNGSLGGLDIFSSAILGNGHFTPPVRLASPLNSPQDDFAISFIDDNNGYISSNRIGGKDAVFQFERITNEQPLQILLVDKDESTPISGVQAYFMSQEACDSKFLTSDEDGRLDPKLLPDLPYNLILYKEGYVPIIINKQNSKYFQDRIISMESIVCTPCPEVAPCAPIITAEGTSVIMTGIYFGLNDWQIRPSAGKEIERLAAHMLANPQTEVEVSAYTDCRGSDTYNLFLSQRRANAVKAYLVRAGVASNRITAIGYGKAKLLNLCDCTPARHCTDVEHEVNRRAEYRFTKQ